MNCQDISRALDSRDVNSLSEVERRAFDAHAASCSHCGPGWIVYTRLAAMPAPLMPQGLAAQCETVASAQLRSVGSRRSSRTIWMGTIVVVAAAAAVLVTRVMPPEAAVSRNTLGASVHSETPDSANSGPEAEAAPGTDGAAMRPVTVSLELIQETDDSMGVAFGQQVYEHAREELRALSSVVLVDARQSATAKPDFRMIYTNASKSGADFFFGTNGLPAPAGKKSDELLFVPDLKFAVQGLGPNADARDLCEARLGQQRVVQPCGGGENHLVSYLGGGPLVPMPVDCVGLRTERCPRTASDIAAVTILQWRLWTAPPDPALEERLHAMLRVSSPPELRSVAFDMLVRHKKLRKDAGELRAVADLILTADEALRTELVIASLKVGNSADLMRQAQDLLLREKPNGDRAVGFQTRQYLVTLLARELKSEPAAQATLESVAANDPYFDVREDARRALGQVVPAD